MQDRVPSSAQRILSGKQFQVPLVVRGSCCIQDGGVCKLHSARPWAARSPLQLQDGHIVGRSSGEEVGRNEKRHLGASNGPVTSQIEAINPDLSLKKHQIRDRLINRC